MTGRADLVEELLDRGAQTIIASAVNTNEPRVSITKHTTPLAMACLYARDASVVELLLRRGADPRQGSTFTGSNALHMAAVNGNIVAFRALMRHDPSLIRTCNKIGFSPLVLGTMTGIPHFYAAVRTEFPEQLKAALLEHDPIASGICQNAIGNGSATLEGLKMILDAGVPVDQVGGDGVGFLKRMVWMAKMVARLRPIGKLPEFIIMLVYLDRSPSLHSAAYMGMLAIADFFIERGADVNHMTSEHGLAPLHFAAIGGHDDVCARLLQKGASPEARDKRGRTALALATQLGHDTVRRRLAAASSKRFQLEAPSAGSRAVVKPTMAPLSTSDRVLPFDHNE